MKGNIIGLSEWSHPAKGIRFTPNTYIDIEEHLVLFSQDLLNDSQEIFVWGHDYAK
jgi:hypothetical protein